MGYIGHEQNAVNAYVGSNTNPGSYSGVKPASYLDKAIFMPELTKGYGDNSKSFSLSYPLTNSKQDSLSLYSTDNKSKPLCCGRRFAGKHMQCGSCPNR